MANARTDDFGETEVSAAARVAPRPFAGLQGRPGPVAFTYDCWVVRPRCVMTARPVRCGRSGTTTKGQCHEALTKGDLSVW